MPRRARLTLPGVPLHIIQRGHNRSACFYRDEDYEVYLQYLRDFSSRFGCTVHAYALMTNHVHMLLTPPDRHSAGLLMKHLGQRYVQYINRMHGRSGTLWEGRFRSCVTQSERYILACYRYIELNPVRAGMVTHPRDYRWSSYAANAEGRSSALIVPHACYVALGASDAARPEAYRSLFDQPLAPPFLTAIRVATNGNFALGSNLFTAEFAAAFGRRVTPGLSGRPGVCPRF